MLRREAQAVIPSVVALSARGRFLVGTAARGQLVTNPRWAVTGFKRLIGKAPTSPEAVETVRRQAFELVASDAGGCAVRLADRTYRIEELYALVLREVKALAEDRLKAPVNRAVISVPAWYTEAQREAVREAGTLAGLHVERLSTDPSAAALAWSHRHQHPQRVLVYDLGGGTFEASVLELKDGVYEVLSSAGDTFLGGSDFDAAIATWALSEFERLNSTSLTDRVAIQRVHEAAERAKVTLSERPEARLVVSLVTVVNQRPLDLDLTLTRSLLDKLTRPLVDRTMEMCQELLRARGLRADQIVNIGIFPENMHINDLVGVDVIVGDKVRLDRASLSCSARSLSPPAPRKTRWPWARRWWATRCSSRRPPPPSSSCHCPSGSPCLGGDSRA